MEKFKQNFILGVGTASVEISVETMPVGPGVDRASVALGVETASVGPGIETGSVRPINETQIFVTYCMLTIILSD